MYLRPVSAFNIGKKSEFYDRKYFREGCKCNRDFINKRGDEQTLEVKEPTPHNMTEEQKGL